MEGEEHNYNMVLHQRRIITHMSLSSHSWITPSLNVNSLSILSLIHHRLHRQAKNWNDHTTLHLSNKELCYWHKAQSRLLQPQFNRNHHHKLLLVHHLLKLKGLLRFSCVLILLVVQPISILVHYILI